MSASQTSEEIASGFPKSMNSTAGTAAAADSGSGDNTRQEQQRKVSAEQTQIAGLDSNSRDSTQLTGPDSNHGTRLKTPDPTRIKSTLAERSAAGKPPSPVGNSCPEMESRREIKTPLTGREDHTWHGAGTAPQDRIFSFPRDLEELALINECRRRRTYIETKSAGDIH